MTTVTKILAAAFAAATITSCSETDYMRFDTSSPGIYFTPDSLDATRDTLAYSFGVTPIDIRTYEYRVSVSLMDGTSDHDRTFACEVMPDLTTATQGVQYTIGQPVIPAGQVRGYIPVTLLRDGLKGDYQNGYVRYKLALRLVAGDGFTPALGERDQIRVLTFDNAVERPEWLNFKGDKVWYEDEWGVWHPLKLIKMAEYFHTVKDILPETYEKMVAAYGENLEHVRFGSFYEYSTVMRKYVFIPMYEYFSNAANRDEILSLYPDFPFDFPEP